MTTLCTQTAIGDIGSKATTTLSSSFTGMLNVGKFQYGTNASGIHLLNTGEDDSGVTYNRQVTLATSDFGIQNPKKIRFLYIGIDTANQFKVDVLVDNKSSRPYTVKPLTSGLQRIRVPIGSDIKGRYWRIRISSDFRFRLDKIEAALIVGSAGTRGY